MASRGYQPAAWVASARTRVWWVRAAVRIWSVGARVPVADCTGLKATRVVVGVMCSASSCRGAVCTVRPRSVWVWKGKVVEVNSPWGRRMWALWGREAAMVPTSWEVVAPRVMSSVGALMSWAKRVRVSSTAWNQWWGSAVAVCQVWVAWVRAWWAVVGGMPYWAVLSQTVSVFHRLSMGGQLR